jgi:hypothetical protein
MNEETTLERVLGYALAVLIGACIAAALVWGLSS